MKFYIFLVLLTLGFIACKSPKKETSTSTPASHKSEKNIIHRVDNATFAAKIADSNAQLVDVRTPDEHAAGTIENSVNINYYDDDFAEQAGSKLDKNKPVLVYCARGGRSAKAAKILKKQGFSEIYDLKTGYTGWDK